jgi:hypothetical protein
MSKLVQAIEASAGRNYQRLGRTKPERLLASMVDIGATMNKDVACHTQTRYSIRVKLGADAWVDDHRPEALPKAIVQTQRAVTEAVFGEFRPYFRELNMAVLDGKYDDLYEILDRFEKQMFKADSFE